MLGLSESLESEPFDITLEGEVSYKAQSEREWSRMSDQFYNVRKLFLTNL